jgi:hypothetical protein
MLRHATTLTVMKIFRPVFKTHSLANIGRTETPEVVRLTKDISDANVRNYRNYALLRFSSRRTGEMTKSIHNCC